jgi:HEAT repeat protein
MRKRFLQVPPLRIWHLLALVAAAAVILAVDRFRHEAHSEVILLLIQARHGDVETRRWAVGKLGFVDPKRSEVIPALIRALDDTDRQVRRNATESLVSLLLSSRILGYANPRAKEVNERLKRQLHDADPKLGLQSALGLMRLNVHTRAVRDCLIERAADSHGNDLRARIDAVRALEEFKWDQPATATVVAALSDPAWLVREQAAISLRRWGPGPFSKLSRNYDQEVPQSVANALTKGLEDESPEVRAASVDSLSFMQAYAYPALAKLVRLLDDPAREPRMRSALLLRSFGRAAEPALVSLRALIDREEDPEVQDAAISAVDGIDRDIKESRVVRERRIPFLLSELVRDDSSRHRVAVSELEEEGKPGKPVASALRRRIADPAASIREAVEAALQMVESVEGSIPSLPAR